MIRLALAALALAALVACGAPEPAGDAGVSGSVSWEVRCPGEATWTGAVPTVETECREGVLRHRAPSGAEQLRAWGSDVVLWGRVPQGEDLTCAGAGSPGAITYTCTLHWSRAGEAVSCPATIRATASCSRGV